MAAYSVSSSAVLPVDADTGLQTVLDAPLEELFTRRSGPIPPIARCEGQDGAWDTVGKTRTVVLTDGTSNVETLVAIDRPGEYRYRLGDFTGPMKLLVGRVDGRFTFVPEGSGTRVTWAWDLHPANPAGRLAMPVLAHFWRGYAAAMWPRLRERLPA